MKSKIPKSFIVFVLCFFGANLTYGIEFSDTWFNCVKDDECIEVEYSCAGAVVNKKYLKPAEEYYERINSIKDCQRKSPTQEMKKVPCKVFCLKNKCKKQGINPKAPAFS